MKYLFVTTRDRCASVAGIRWADKDYKQLDIYDPNGKPSVDFPCALIKLATTGIQTIATNQQLLTVQVTVRIAYNLATVETSASATQTAQDRSMSIDDYADAVFNKLQNYTDGFITNFDRIYQGDEDRKDNLQVIRQIYTCTFTQFS